jgi:two-component system LytT family response regulator
MTKILIVDDEPMARLRIRKLAEGRSDVTAIEEAGDGVEALAKMAEFLPDVVFLDIEMPEMTGFEVLENLEVVPFVVVFQTAYQQFAIKAFEVNACDYLLKPFTDERWAESLERARRSMGARANQIEGLREHLHQQGMFLNRLLIRSQVSREKRRRLRDVLDI